MVKKYVYSDVDRNMKIDSNGNVSILYDNDVIVQSLKMIFAAVQGEYVRSLRGSRLVFLLGRPFSDTTTDLITQDITRTVEMYEPRVQIRNISVEPDNDNNVYHVRLFLSVLRLGDLTFDTTLRRM